MMKIYIKNKLVSLGILNLFCNSLSVHMNILVCLLFSAIVQMNMTVMINPAGSKLVVML